MARAAHLAWIVLALSGVWACGPASSPHEGQTPPGVGEPCSGALTRCNGLDYQACEDGAWAQQDHCTAPDICAIGAGCVQCNPEHVRTCRGNDVVTCRPDGTWGEMVETCGFEGCSGGTCGPPSDCAQGAELIYVVDDTYRLLSFDPRDGANTFQLIGSLSCPTMYDPWPGTDYPPPPTPFSMSVDRSATAWVLYSSGEMFLVSTTDASCSPSGWTRGAEGYQLFGMGFVSDDAGGSAETLYISGGAATDIQGGHLGSIDPSSMAVHTIGPLTAAEYSPELTGTGEGELYGYYPGALSSFVNQLDRGSGGEMERWNLPPLDGQVMAWAFAHWGGRFYIFVTDGDPFFGFTNSRVLLLDPATGSTTTLLESLPYIIVGAGVSTCAPVEIE